MATFASLAEAQTFFEGDRFATLAGMKLDELNTMFADSVEFANIVSSYGLNPNL